MTIVLNQTLNRNATDVTMTANTTTLLHRESTMRDYMTLLKPGVMSLVVFTALIGMMLAPSQLHPFEQLLAIGCIALGSGAGAALNMWFDRDIDAIMKRTAGRPLPRGVVTPDDALSLGLFLSVFSVVVMGLATNWIAGGLLAFAIFFYAVIYTMWLKRATPQNIVIGGAAGAFPPTIGWLAASPDTMLLPWLLFAIIFLWTPPHFWALALYKHGDYQKAGVPMLPVTHGLAHTRRNIWWYSLALVGGSLLPGWFGLGHAYTLVALVLGAVFLRLAWRVLNGDNERHAKQLFFYSILYLFLLFALMPVARLVGA